MKTKIEHCAIIHCKNNDNGNCNLEALRIGNDSGTIRGACKAFDSRLNPAINPDTGITMHGINEEYK